MKLRSHVVASIMFSTLFFLVFKSWTIAVVSFFSGVLIDCDHILDYFWEFRKRLRVKELFDAHYNGKISFSGVMLHSWELLFLLNIYAFIISCNLWAIGVALGLTQHVALDQIFNKSNRLSYFFLWRLKNKFNAKVMFTK